MSARRGSWLVAAAGCVGSLGAHACRERDESDPLPHQMIGIIEIYACALALLALVGSAARSVIFPGDGLLRADILPLGLSVLVLVQYLAVYLVPVPVATFVVIGVCVLVLGRHVWRARHSPPEGRVSVRGQSRLEVVTLAIGVLLGLGALIPLFLLGFPSAIAISIADGWAYAAELSWLRGHSLSDVIPTGPRYPLNNVLPAQFKGGLGIGFEMFGTAVLAITRRQPFELINAVSATAFAIAAAGWRELWCVVRGRADGVASVVITLAAASPLMVFLFAENQVPNLLALSLMPFVLASALRFAIAPALRTFVVVSVAAGATLGIYTPLAAWLFAGLIAAIVAGTLRDDPIVLRPSGVRLRSALAGYVTKVGVLIVLLVCSIGVMAALPVRQFVRALGSGATTGVQAVLLSGTDRLMLFTGAAVRGNFGLDVTFGDTLWSARVAVVVVFVVAAVAAVAWARSWRQLASARIAVVSVALAVATAVTINRFPGDGYAEWKALIVSAALAAGLLLLIMVTPATLSLRWVQVGIAASAIVWLGTSGLLLARTLPGEGLLGAQGFRGPDVQLGAALSRLPKGSVVLVEGIAQDATAFRMRMMTAYFGTQAHLLLEGLGTTPSYVAPAPEPTGAPAGFLPSAAGDPIWAPKEPWQWVVDAASGTIATARGRIWSNAVYGISSAPMLDATPFGLDWISFVVHHGRWATFLGGSGELLVSNRSALRRQVVLSMRVASRGTARDVQVLQAGTHLRVRFVARTARRVRILLSLGVHSVVQVPLTVQVLGSPQPVLPLLVSHVVISPA